MFWNKSKTYQVISLVVRRIKGSHTHARTHTRTHTLLIEYQSKENHYCNIERGKNYKVARNAHILVKGSNECIYFPIEILWLLPINLMSMI